MNTHRRGTQWQTVGLLALLIMLPALALAEEPTVTSATELKQVAVEHQPDATIVHVTTSGAAKYHAEFMDSPNRLVVDLEDTVYAWRKAPLSVSEAPVKEIRGSQYRKGVARLVIEFTRKVGYAIREDEDGLTIVVARAVAATDTTAVPPVAPQPRVMASVPTEPKEALSAAPAELRPTAVPPVPPDPYAKIETAAPIRPAPPM